MTPRTHSGGRTVTLPALTQGDGILVVDADLKIVHINAPLQSLLSVTREELLGADASLVIRKYLFPLLSEGGFGEQIFALLRDGPCLPSITLSIRVPGPAGDYRSRGAVETATPVRLCLPRYRERAATGEERSQLVTLLSNLRV
jgi:PAS domain-containing protein